MCVCVWVLVCLCVDLWVRVCVFAYVRARRVVGVNLNEGGCVDGELRRAE